MCDHTKYAFLKCFNNTHGYTASSMQENLEMKSEANCTYIHFGNLKKLTLERKLIKNSSH